MEIPRRRLRRLLFAIRDNAGNLDREDRDLRDLIYEDFNGYLSGAFGWQDFSFKWDISPGLPKEVNNASHRKLNISDWAGEIMVLWEWKSYMKQFEELYGKFAILPTCFTRQETINNGTKSNI